MEESQWLMEKTADRQYVLGDLNLDPQISDQNSNISTISGHEKSMLLKEITTKYKKQLDHILRKGKTSLNVFTTAFTNFVSDHKAVVMRISLSNANFVDDPRLKSKEQVLPSSEDVEEMDTSSQ